METEIANAANHQAIVSSTQQSAASRQGLAWKIFKNASSQMVGRIIIALGRLVVAGIIVRSFGRVTFGEYSMIFGLLSLAEWIGDFGTTEISVREICRDRSKRSSILSSVAAAKLLQIPAAMLVLVAIVAVLHYSAEVRNAAFASALSLIFFGGILIFRARFKADMSMELEVGAETISVLAMIPLVVGCTKYGLLGLIGAHIASRAVFLGGCMLLSRSLPESPMPEALRPKTFSLLKSSVAIGFIGMLVGNYETIDVLVLSKLSSFSELALYSAAQRLLWPSLIVFGSIAATIYPVAATHWPEQPERFLEVCQNALNAVVTMAGLLLTVMLACPEVFLQLLGRDLIAAAPILRVLALLCFVKAITATVGPMLYIVNAQKKMLQFIVVAVCVKIAALSFLAWKAGAVGTAWGALAVEVIFATVPAVLVYQRFSRLRIDWRTSAYSLMSAAVIGYVTKICLSAPAVGPRGIIALAVASSTYIVAAFALGTVQVDQIRWLLRWKPA